MGLCPGDCPASEFTIGSDVPTTSGIVIVPALPGCDQELEAPKDPCSQLPIPLVCLAVIKGSKPPSDFGSYNHKDRAEITMGPFLWADAKVPT